MDVAYDKQLNTLVTATEACKSKQWHSSYKCPHCEREVVLIPSSGRYENRRAYFRHQKGSYAEDCEKYASMAYSYYKSHGSFVGFSSSHSECKIAVSANREQRNFFFSIDITLSDAFLQQTRRKILSYAALVTGRIVENLHQYEISNDNFIPNVESKYRLNVVGEEILVKIGTEERKIPLFLKDVTFFNIASNIDLYTMSDYTAKRVENGIVFVGEEYIIASRYDVSKASFPNVEFVSHGYHNGYFIIGTIAKEYSETFANFCNQFEYKLRPREEHIEILWPPTFPNKNNLITNARRIYLYSSIELDTEKNCYGAVIHLESNLFGVNIAEETKILLNEKIINIKPTLIKYQSVPEGFSYTIEEMPERNIIMHQDGFLVRQDMPTTQIKKGQSVWLTDDAEIRLYRSNYLKTIIHPIVKNDDSLESKLTDILQHSKATVPLEIADLCYNGVDEILLRYIDQCRRKGKINPAVRKLLTKE